MAEQERGRRVAVQGVDRAAAMKIFDELGLKDTNGDGYREYPAGGPQAGETIGWLMPAPAQPWLPSK